MDRRSWNKLGDMIEECYDFMIGENKDHLCWEKTFDILKSTIMKERMKNPEFGRRLILLDEQTDYSYDLLGWLEDCLDEMDMMQKYNVLLEACDWLLEQFCWEEESPSDLLFRKSTALSSLGRVKESEQFCEEWMKKEPDNIYAATAAVYTKLDLKKYEDAEKIVAYWIGEDIECTDENDIMFSAAEKLYQLTGEKKKLKNIQNAIKNYEKKLEEMFEELDAEEYSFEEYDFDDEDLPFS